MSLLDVVADDDGWVAVKNARDDVWWSHQGPKGWGRAWMDDTQIVVVSLTTNEVERWRVRIDGGGDAVLPMLQMAITQATRQAN